MSKSKHIGGIFCRMVGPGGTYVDFYLEGDTIKCIWTNENCPYDWSPYDPETEEAEDGHNVSYFPLNFTSLLRKMVSKQLFKQIKAELENGRV